MGQQHDFYLVQSGNLVPRAALWRGFLACFQQPSLLRPANLDSSGWKYVANRALTKLENWVFGLSLSEYHTGYRAYSREALERVNFQMNSDQFIFDQEIIAQMVEVETRFVEVAVPTRYFPEASSTSFLQSCRYGLSILQLLLRFLLHRTRILRQRRFDSLGMRYEVGARGPTTPPAEGQQAGDSSP